MTGEGVCRSARRCGLTDDRMLLSCRIGMMANMLEKAVMGMAKHHPYGEGDFPWSDGTPVRRSWTEVAPWRQQGHWEFYGISRMECAGITGGRGEVRQSGGDGRRLCGVRG